MTPILTAEVVVVDLVHVVIICPICGKFHRHGSCGDINRTDYGSRVPHCAGEDFHRPTGDYSLITVPGTIRRKKLRAQDIECWRELQESRRAALVERWRAQEAEELDTKILAAVRAIHAHGGQLARHRIALWAGVTPHAVTLWMHKRCIYYGCGRYQAISRHQAGSELCKIFPLIGGEVQP